MHAVLVCLMTVAFAMCGGSSLASGDESPARSALLMLSESGGNPRAIAAEFNAEAIAPIAIELAETHPDFQSGKRGRRGLVQALLLAKSERGAGLWSERSPRGDFLLSELFEGTPDVQLLILNALLASPGLYQSQVCEFLEEQVSAIDEIHDVPVLVQSLYVLANGCDPNSRLVEPLRRLVLDGEVGIDGAVLERDQATTRRAASIPSAAAHALLAITPEVSETIEWLHSLKDGERALAARRAFVGGAAPEQRFDALNQDVQGQWMSALLDTMRSTLAQSPLTQDEFAVLVSLGERFPQFRQDVGDFLQERLDAGVRDPHQAAGTRQVLERWSKTP